MEQHEEQITVPEIIQELQNRGYRIEEIARELKVCGQTIYRWKWGKFFPNPKNLQDLINLWQAKIEGVK